MHVRLAWQRFGTRVLLTLAGGLCGLRGVAQQGVWQQTSLANGLRVAYCQDSTRKLLHLGLTLRGGASLDEIGHCGLALLYEHLFFQYLPDSTPATQAGEQGVFLSHSTALESHFFGMSLAAGQEQAALEVLAQGLATTTWRDSSLRAAKGRVATVLQTWENAPENHLGMEVREALWGLAAIQKHIHGRYADVVALTVEALLEATEGYRHPQNCFLAATGTDSAGAFFSVAAATLGRWQPRGAGAGLPAMAVPELDSSVYFTSVNEFATQPLMMLAWPVATAEAAATVAQEAELFCQLAGLRQGSFHRRLVGGGLARSYAWSYAGGLLPGQLLLYVFPVVDSLAPCLQAIQDELGKMGEENGIRKEDVAAALRLRQLHVAQRNDHSLSRLLDAGQSWQLGWEPAEDLPAPTAAGLRRFCAAYLCYRPHVGGLLLNSGLLATLEAGPGFRVPPPTVPSVVAATVGLDSVRQPKVARCTDPAVLRSYRVHFDPEGSHVEDASLPLLDDLATLLLAQPKKRVYLNSFSEGAGDGVKNYQGSVSRAKALRTWLHAEKGVPLNQLVIRAYGEAFPEFPGDHDLRNRRMTFDFAPHDAQDNAF